MTNVLSTPYKLARLPLSLFDSTVTERLPEGSAPRLVVDRAIGSADRLAGSLLRDPAIAERGAARLERSHRLATATHLEERAAAKRAQAEDRAVTGLERADEAEEQGKQQARAEADEAEARKKAAAEKRAAARKDAASQRKEREKAAARTQRSSAQAKAKDRLEDAGETKKSARGKRAESERLDELADTKKRQRTTS